MCKILAAKRADPQANTSALEGEIDLLVALRKLCGLSEDEVKIVEGGTNGDSLFSINNLCY